MRVAFVLTMLYAATWGAAPGAVAAENPGSSTVLGATSLLLAEGAAALDQGRVDDGIRLTLEGLKLTSSAQEIAAGHANLCAGYAMLKRWDEALAHCNTSLELDATNWRAFNNRCAVFVAQGLYDLAIADVLAGLKLAPESSTLKKSLQIAYDHKRAHRDRSRAATSA
jgi:tetratricopeptide (TPR) repeat protein